MGQFFKNIRFRIEYIFMVGVCVFIRSLPYGFLRPLAELAGFCIFLIPSARKTVRENINAALPELPLRERRRIGRRSFWHLTMNLLEFIWTNNRPERIRRCYAMPDDLRERLQAHLARNERIIFVNPHLGSWEASGIVAPFYAGIKMAAIAKPMRNPYLNQLLNADNREKTAGLEVIFSKGAVRAALQALADGKSIGTLIDQNTRGRDGGIFVDFFGLPVPSSTAPAVLKRRCDARGIPVVIMYGTTVRLDDGKCTAHTVYLSKPFESYADDAEVIRELMALSESFIRKYPEQYLWFYKRFQYIPPDCPPEIRKRYPAYARVVRAEFFKRSTRA